MEYSLELRMLNGRYKRARFRSSPLPHVNHIRSHIAISPPIPALNCDSKGAPMVTYRLNTKVAYPILLYGSGALVALWLASAVVGAIESIPLFSKLMEVVGFGYSIWFCSRYLLFKENRDELAAKIEELKRQVLGLSDDCNNAEAKNGKNKNEAKDSWESNAFGRNLN